MFFAVYSEKKSIFKDFLHMEDEQKEKQNKERGVGKIE